MGILFFIYTICLMFDFDFLRKENYSLKEIYNLKKGDTLYYQQFRSINKFVVQKNLKERRLIEVVDLKYTYKFTEIITYEDLRFYK